ncbi:MAG: OmpA family protein [Bacteroidota bacterium]
MKDSDFFTSLFQEQRAQMSTPAFEQVFGAAQQKYRRMNIQKWSLIAALLTAFVLGSIVLTSKDAGKEVPTVQASVNIYKALTTNGKFVTNDIYFEYDKAVIKAESIEVIESVYTVLKENPKFRLSIEGHTDSHGSSSYNQQLSTLRAAAIKQYLLKKGIADNRLSSKGFGETKPAQSNDTEEGRKQNRRVEFVMQ